MYAENFHFANVLPHKNWIFSLLKMCYTGPVLDKVCITLPLPLVGLITELGTKSNENC